MTASEVPPTTFLHLDTSPLSKALVVLTHYTNFPSTQIQQSQQKLQLVTSTTTITDLKTLCTLLCTLTKRIDILPGTTAVAQSTINENDLSTPNQIITFLSQSPSNFEQLDQSLLHYSFIGKSHKLTYLDILACSVLHPTIESTNFPNILRWYKYLQSNLLTSLIASNIKLIHFPNEHPCIFSKPLPLFQLVSKKGIFQNESNTAALPSKIGENTTTNTTAPEASNAKISDASATGKPTLTKEQMDAANEKRSAKKAEKAKKVSTSTEKGPLLPQSVLPKAHLVVGTIKSINRHQIDERLSIFQVDLGSQSQQIVSSVNECLKPPKSGDQVVVLMNIPKADIKGVESNGRILLAVSDGKKEVLHVKCSASAGAALHVKDNEKKELIAQPTEWEQINSKNLTKLLKELTIDAEGKLKSGNLAVCLGDLDVGSETLKNATVS